MKKINQTKIDNYLLDRMSKSDKNAFERRIKMDANLAQEVALKKEAIGMIEKSEDQRNRYSVKQIHKAKKK